MSCIQSVGDLVAALSQYPEATLVTFSTEDSSAPYPFLRVFSAGVTEIIPERDLWGVVSLTVRLVGESNKDYENPDGDGDTEGACLGDVGG